MPRVSTHNVSPTDELAAQLKEFHKRINSLERASTSGVSPGDLDARYVNVTGDTMTGPLQINYNAAGAINFGGDSSYIAFFNANNAARRGYIQGLSTGLLLNSEAGVLNLMGVGGVQVNQLNFPGGHTLTNPAGDGWMRPSSNFYVGLGQLGVGPNGLSVGTGGVITGGYLCDFAGKLRVNGVDINGSIGFFPANPTISASSYIIMPGGLYVSGGTLYSGATIQARGGIMNDSGAGAPGTRITGSGANYPAGWTQSQLQIMENSGGQHTAYCLNSGPYAPIMRDYGPYGDRFDCLNNPNTSYCSVAALSFAVQPSSQRFKHDIRTIEDDLLLGLVSDVKTHRFTMNIGPMTIPMTDRFIDLNRRWIARGHRPLTPTGNCFGGEAEPHDCDNPRHWCLGAPGHPCPVTKNDTPRYGLIAEQLSDHVPEAVNYGEDELPMGYEIDQIAAIAFGGVGALLRKIEALTRRVEELEQDRYQLQGVAA